jgi:hypothetical protein
LRVNLWSPNLSWSLVCDGRFGSEGMPATLRRSFGYDRLIESYVMAVRSRFSCWMLGLGVSMIMGMEQRAYGLLLAYLYWDRRRPVPAGLLYSAQRGTHLPCTKVKSFGAVSIAEFDSVIRAVSLDPTKSTDDGANDASCQAQKLALHHSYYYFRSPNFVQILRI